MLHLASMDGDAEVIELFLSHDQSLINVQNAFGVTPLMYAIRSGDIESIKLLIAFGADLEAEDVYGNNVLSYTDSIELQEILNGYMSPNIINVDDNNLASATHTAIEYALNDIPAAITIIDHFNVEIDIVMFQYPSNAFLVVINDASGYSYGNGEFYNSLEASFVELAEEGDYTVIDLQHVYLPEYNEGNLLALIRSMPRLEGMSQEEIIEIVPFAHNERPLVNLQDLIHPIDIGHEVIAFQDLSISAWSLLGCKSAHSLSYFIP